jgi:hypothetical protein
VTPPTPPGASTRHPEIRQQPIKAYFAAAEGTVGLFWLAAALSLLYPSAGVVYLYQRFRLRAMAG